MAENHNSFNHGFISECVGKKQDQELTLRVYAVLTVCQTISREVTMRWGSYSLEFLPIRSDRCWKKSDDETRKWPDTDDAKKLKDVQKCTQGTVYSHIVWGHLSSSHCEREGRHQLCSSVQLMQPINLVESKK